MKVEMLPLESLITIYIKAKKVIPVGIWCQNDVVSTSMRRDHVASMLIRRHFYVMCLLGLAQLSTS